MSCHVYTYVWQMAQILIIIKEKRGNVFQFVNYFISLPTICNQ